MSSITSIYKSIAITTTNKLEMHQMDVKATFLNDDLEYEVYIEQLEGFIINKKRRLEASQIII